MGIMTTEPGGISSIPDTRERFLAFVREREAVRQRKEAGEPSPWTTDPVLQTYRFCNIRREDDRVTRWIGENWRDPHADDPDLWFAMVVARFVNWPDTLAEVGYPVPWNPKRWLKVAHERKAKKQKIWTGAYMIRADSGRPRGDKAEYQSESVFGPLWKKRKQLRPQPGDTLNSYHMLLGMFHGFGSFLAAQIVADLKYAPPLNRASDWMTFAASGPGSRRGLNRVTGREKNSPWHEDEWRLELARVQEWLNRGLGWSEPLHAQDCQNATCEWDKHERVRLGEGRPRAKYQYQQHD